MKHYISLLLLAIVFSADLAVGQWCSVTEWTSWECSVTCGNGTFIRTRNCIRPDLTLCTNCSDTNYLPQETQTLPCIRNECPFCFWTNWTVFPCSSSCSTGFRLQTRECLSNNGGLCGTCIGSDTISEPCTEQAICPSRCGINSHYEENYLDCGITCQNRLITASPTSCETRSTCVCDSGYFFDALSNRCVRECDCGCLDSNDQYRQLNQIWNETCITQQCNTGGRITTINVFCNISAVPTPINGGWSDWFDPDPIVCSASCGNGNRVQYRTCTNPSPASGGAYCSGTGIQLIACNSNITCPAADSWSTWSSYSSCSVTCGNGTRTSYRNCTRTVSGGPGDQPCNGSSTRIILCDEGSCPVNGVWTNYSSFSPCSSICSPGIQASSRNCVNQTSGGFSCSGFGLLIQNCSGVIASYQCDAIGFWSNWSSLSECSASCGLGYQYQTRQCLGAGFGCVGEAINTVICNSSTPCPVDGNWTMWSSWSSCPTTCGTATVFRTRQCIGAANGGVCLGSALDTQICDTGVSCSQTYFNSTDGDFTTWSAWSTCSSTCGSGQRSRTRSCTNPSPSYGGLYCSGSPIEVQSCNATQSCPINGGWATWTTWSTCSGTCGNGTRSRRRLCSNPAPAFGGQLCPGSAIALQNCSVGIPCPVDGIWSPWATDGTCYGVCGNGTRIYTRNCTQQVGGGMICYGPSKLEESCIIGRPCAINGDWSQWSSYTACSVTCGVGVYSRIRECNNPVAQYGGDLCIGSALETAYCLTNITCPIHGGWTPWTEWNDCSITCVGGTQTRTRQCTNPRPQFNGVPCIGSSFQYQTCNDDVPCVTLIPGDLINGTWATWSTWSSCGGTCGNGTRTRFRDCSGRYNGGYPCVGASLESQSCATNVTCPINGAWSAFRPYGPCSATCGNGTRIRTRDCASPTPRFGGAHCVGSAVQAITCSSNRACPIDGNWAPWSESVCSSTCGIGYRIRQRNCSNPAPQNGGAPCIGLAMDTVLCNVSNVSCPVMGQYGPWVTAVRCTATCGFGVTIRNRTCLPVGTNNCVGDSIQIETCDSGVACPTIAPWNSVNGNWSEWAEWSPCSASCGLGTQYSTRECNDTTPSNGGSLCRGDPIRTRTCETDISCPVDGNWTEWSQFSPCSVTCGTGIRTQIRYCNNTDNFNQLCIGEALRTSVCNASIQCPNPGIWGSWSAWSTCAGSCGTGVQVRTRQCATQSGGAQCSGSPIEARACNIDTLCPVDGGWDQWTEWTPCSSGTCAAGSRYRYRSCVNPIPSNGGQLCQGDAVQTMICYGISTCPIDGNWASWEAWGSCSSTCVGGRRLRYRNCTNPAPSNGGLPCIGANLEVDSSCGNGSCGVNIPINIGTWSAWEEWSACAASCGNGIRRRVRNCSTAGLPCIGSYFEHESCGSLISCPVDGIWSAWSNYSECTASCGVGIQTRTRLCNGPFNGGSPCPGSPTQTQTCNTSVSCPINGQWTAWSSLGPCTATCGIGTAVRTRTCSQVIPTFGGISCPGSPILVETCSATVSCPVTPQWSSWAPWSACSATCGVNATKYTTRTCNDSSAAFVATGCIGSAINVTTCVGLPDCPVCSTNQLLYETQPTVCPSLCSDPNNTNWCLRTPWTSRCLCQPPYAWNNETNTCTFWCDCGCYGANYQKHTLGEVWVENNCSTYQCLAALGTSGETKPETSLISTSCSVNCSYFGWSAWSSCSATCGQGVQSRNRACRSVTTGQQCNSCSGEANQTRVCLLGTCETCVLSPPQPATPCSRTCGGGTQLLNQTCLNVAATSLPVPDICSSSARCPSANTTVASCGNDICIECTWSAWVNGRCSVTCGTGFYVRTRYCRTQFLEACTVCTRNNDTNGTRPCYFPSCSAIGRRRRSFMDWFKSWLE